MQKKYELTQETRRVEDRTLYRIKALRDFRGVKAGDLGGFVENEHNLSHRGYCWIRDDACVFSNAKVSGDAQVSDDAQIFGDARICGDAIVSGNAKVSGDAWISDSAEVRGDAQIVDFAKVIHHAQIAASITIAGNDCINGYTRITTSFTTPA